MDIVLYDEYFRLDGVRDCLEDTYFDEAFDQQYMDAIYTEAISGTNTKNIFQKIISFILKGLKFLWSKLKQLANWIKSKITGKDKKTANQIAREIVGDKTPNAKNKSDKPVRVEIPSNPASQAKIDQIIDVAFEPMQFAFDHDALDIMIDYSAALSNNTGGNVPHGKSAPSELQALFVIGLIENPSYRRLVEEIVDGMAKLFTPASLSTAPTGVKKIAEFSPGPAQEAADLARLNGLIEKCLKLEDALNTAGYHIYSYKRHKVTLGSIAECGKLINKAVDVVSNFEASFIRPNVMNSKLASDENPNWKVPNGITMTPKALKTFNTFSMIIQVLGFGMNQITHGLNRVYMIDATYMNAIDDQESLSKFVEKMAAAGIPSKYIMQNAYLISSKKLRGDGSPDKPIWGQSRCVFYPNKANYIIKVAYNPIGKIGNRNEAYITKLLHGQPEENLVAKVTKISKNGFVTQGEKVRIPKNGASWDVCNRIQSEINRSQVLKDTNISIEDIHSNNIGYRSDKSPCIVDYGAVARN